MDLEILARQLRLIVALTQNRYESVDDLCERLQLSRRTIYRYIEAFESMGFIVRKRGSYFSIDASSPFFAKLAQGITFSEDEALTISQVLNSVYDNSAQVRHLRRKLAHLYNTELLSKHGVDNRVAANISLIYQAISMERTVILRNYNSPSGGKISHRIVEPYLFLNENSEVRCYEIASGMNKTFKLSRCESVELVDLLWSHKDRHAAFTTDLFGFTGEERTPVSLLLGSLSTNILLEEYPDSRRCLTQQADGRHLFCTEVCSYLGIGRFVMGLFEDIEIVDSPDFQGYVDNRIAALQRK